jgi:hypothetical protein
MTQNGVKSDAVSFYFMQEPSAPIRIWHQQTCNIISAAKVTELLNATLLYPGKNTGTVQEQLQPKGLTATEDQAFAVSREYK